MVLLTHPFGNANVRAVLAALDGASLLARFVTTFGWSQNSYPILTAKMRGRLRRNYALPADKIDIHAFRESVRLLAGFLRARGLTAHESGWASTDRVWQSLDREAARRLRHGEYGPDVCAVYAYEDCAERLFATARDLGLKRVYDLPIAYWETTQRLLRGHEHDRLRCGRACGDGLDPSLAQLVSRSISRLHLRTAAAASGGAPSHAQL